jgi:hypothetical protein
LAGLAWSWNRQPWVADGRLARVGKQAGIEALAGLRILLALSLAMSFEWHLAPLAFAGQAPVPFVVPVVVCYVLTSTYGRMLFAAMLAGLLHDAFSPSMPLGCSSLFFLLAAAVGRELCENTRREGMVDQLLVGLLVPVLVGLANHLVLAASGVAGSASAGEVVRRVLGTAFMAAVVMTPLLRVAKVLGGRAARWAAVLFLMGLAWLADWTLRHVNLPERGTSPLPEPALPVRF